jgi:MarR family transcriptional regulator, lower aerobic nicotinate degradation pathway regulator
MLDELTPYLLSLTGREARRRMAAEVSLPEFALLAALSGGPASQRELSERLGKDPADIVRLVDAAASRGLLDRAPDPADRRRHAVTLTADGRAELRRMMTAAREVESDLLAPLDAGERRTLYALLAKLPR